MNTIFFARLCTPIYAFLIGAISLTLVSCGDRVLPVDDGTGSGTQYDIVYNRLEKDPFRAVKGINMLGPNGANLMPVTTSGYPITSPPANGYIAIINPGKEFINVVDLKSATVVKQTPRKYGADINYFSASISPNGDKVAYSVKYNDGGGLVNKDTRRIVIADINRDNYVILNVGASHESFTRFSPSGEYVAFFDVDTSDAFGNNGWLYVAKVDGSDTRRIADVDKVAHDGYMHFAWSPDGTEIAYSDFGDQTLYIAATDGSGKRSMGPGVWPDWSQDGKQLLFVGSTGKPTIAHSNGSGVIKTLNNIGILPQWSPDGKKILLFEADPNIEIDKQTLKVVVVDAETEESNTIATDAYDGYWVK